MCPKSASMQLQTVDKTCASISSHFVKCCIVVCFCQGMCIRILFGDPYVFIKTVKWRWVRLEAQCKRRVSIYFFVCCLRLWSPTIAVPMPVIRTRWDTWSYSGCSAAHWAVSSELSVLAHTMPRRSRDQPCTAARSLWWLSVALFLIQQMQDITCKDPGG